MANEVTKRVSATSEFGHKVTVEMMDGVIDKQLYRHSIEVNTHTGEKNVTYCPSCIDAANLLIVEHRLVDLAA